MTGTVDQEATDGGFSAMLKDFSNFEGDTDNASDEEVGEQVDEDAINKELVTWAGRLELESMDLREKAKELTIQMAQNSESIKNTSNDLKEQFMMWKGSSTKLLEGTIESFGKASSNLLSASRNKSNTPNQAHTKLIPEIFDLLKSTHSSIEQFEKTMNPKKNDGSNNKKGSQIDNDPLPANLSRKLQTIVKSIQRFHDHNTREEELKKETNNNISQLNETLGKCLRRVEDIQNLQVDFGHELKTLRRSQGKLLDEFNKMKSTSTINTAISTLNQNNRPSANQFRPLSPKSSFNGTISDQVWAQTPGSPKRPNPKKARTVISKPKPNTPQVTSKTPRTRRNFKLVEHERLNENLSKSYQRRKKKILQDRTNQTASPHPKLQPGKQNHQDQSSGQQSQPVFSSSSFDKHDTNNCISLLSDDVQSNSANSDL